MEQPKDFTQYTYTLGKTRNTVRLWRGNKLIKTLHNRNAKEFLDSVYLHQRQGNDSLEEIGRLVFAFSDYEKTLRPDLGECM